MSILKNQELRSKFLVVLLFFALYKIGTYIPVPGTNAELLRDIIDSNQGLGLANMFSGGALSNFSIFAIGVMPYITASIIIQLLSMNIVPTLVEWKKQGEDGEKKTKKLTYIATVVFALFQSIGLSIGFNKMMPGIVEGSWVSYVIISLCLTLGTVLLLIFAEIIERKGLGKGISMIILAGILMVTPTSLYQYVISEKGETWTEFGFIAQTVLFATILFVITLMIIQVHRGERRIPISNTSSGSKYGIANKATNFLPIKLNPSGVMPVIFAMTLFMSPRTIALMFPNNSVSEWINLHVTYESPIGMTFFALLIFGFTFFYGFVVSNPEKMSQNLQNGGNFIPGVRPGAATEEKIRFIMKHLLFVGAVFLAFISVLPILITMIGQLPSSILIGGTSLIILVNVIADIRDQVGVKNLSKSYKGFINK